MDFGFGSLVDKFEERIGRRPTSALLWLAAFALFVVCARTIITEGIIPTVAFVRGVSSQSVLGLLSSFLYGGAVAIASALLFVLVVRLLIRRLTLAFIQRAQAQIRRAQEAVERADAHGAEIEERLERLITAKEEESGLTHAEEAKKLLEEARTDAEDGKALLRAMLNTAGKLMERADITDEERAEIREVIAGLHSDLDGAEEKRP